MTHVNPDEQTASTLLIQLIQDITAMDDQGNLTGEYVMLNHDDIGMRFIREDATGEPLIFFVKRATPLELEKMKLVEQLMEPHFYRDGVPVTLPTKSLDATTQALLARLLQDMTPAGKSQRAVEDAVPENPDER